MTLQPQDTLAHYRLVEVLGEGGMGVVWLAEDTKLGRKVALKVLPPERVGDEERRLRFLREARTAAAVNHPNIAAIYEIGEVGETIFIAMELVEGTTLRARMADGRLPMREIRRFSVEIGEAMASAHQARIVHRDLKPDNVMVRPDGHVKILDFGLAKLHESDAEQATASTRVETISAEMTREGRIFGTAAYMSPEQARGRKVDFRSDLFSFGVVLYEMVTGKSPFQNDNITDTLSSVVRDHPRDAAELEPQMPAELGRILQKCLEKDPAERFQDTADLTVDLRKLRRTTDSQPLTRVTDSAPVTAVRTPLWRRPPVLALAGLAALALAVLLIMMALPASPGRGTGSGAERALAVMPFENLKQADDPERLGQILQELIITDLSDVDTLGVFSSQRLYDVHRQIAGTSDRVIDPSRITEVANRAGATTLLTGSLSQLGSRWILTGQLVDVDSGKVLQSERIDGEDLYRMVDQLADKIRADLVEATLAAGADRAVGERTTDSLEAYQAYLEGVELLSQRDYTAADEMLVQALELDPAFGLAQYQLASVRGWLRNPGKETPAELLEALLEEGAFKLPEKERLLARTDLAFQRSDFAEGERLARRAIERYPDEKESWFNLGDVLYHAPGEDYDEAMEMFDRALELDPTYEPAYVHIGQVYEIQGLWAELADKVQALVRSQPENPAWYAAWAKALLQQGNADGAEGILQDGLARIRDPKDKRRLLRDVGGAFIAAWQRERGKELLDQALEVEAADGEDALRAALGRYALANHEYESAEQQFWRALEINPTHVGSFWGLRNTLYRQRKYGEAILKFRSLIARAPDHLLLYRGWMDAALRRGDEPEAERAFEELLSRTTSDSGRSTAWFHRANSYTGIGDRVRAFEYRRQAVELTADPAEWDLGWDYKALGRLEEAESAFLAYTKESRIDQNQGASQAYFEVLRDLGKTEEALRFAERWRKLRPADNRSHEAVIEIHNMAGREADADRALEAGLDFRRLLSGRADLLVRATGSYSAAGRDERAEELIRQALALEGAESVDWFWGVLLHVLLQQQKYDEMEQVLDQQEAVQGGYLPLWIERFRIPLALGRGDTDAALRVALDHLSKRPIDARSLSAVAGTLAAREEFAEAEQYARKVFAMHPNREHHWLLAWILIAGEIDVDQGLALAEKARTLPGHWSEPVILEARPWAPSLEHALGLAHLKQGRPAEAIPLLEEAARLQPNRKLVREHLEQARR
jgi:tetratricopeptide (TPR) repeat protein